MQKESPRKIGDNVSVLNLQRKIKVFRFFFQLFCFVDKALFTAFGQKVRHAFKADAESRHIVKHCGSRGLNKARNTENYKHKVESDNEAVVSVYPLCQS